MNEILDFSFAYDRRWMIIETRRKDNFVMAPLTLNDLIILRKIAAVKNFAESPA